MRNCLQQDTEVVRRTMHVFGKSTEVVEQAQSIAGTDEFGGSGPFYD